MNVTTPLRLVFNPTGRLLAAARACEAEIFLQTYGNSLEELQAEYSRYEDASVFIALADPDDKVIGVCRLIMPNPAGFKSLNDLAHAPWHVDGERSARAAGVDLESAWDFATVGVRADAGSARMFAAVALYHAVLKAGQANGIESVLMIMDDRALQLISACGITTHRLPATKSAPYLGSAASTPVYGNFAEMLDTARRTNPDAFRLVGQGIGLDGVTVPGVEEFMLPERRPLAASATA